MSVRTLVDTCVMSEAWRPKGDRRVKARLAAVNPADLFTSVITIGELVRGAELLTRTDQGDRLHAWIRRIEADHGSRVLPVDVRIARKWGEVHARCRRAGVTLPSADGLIAATAIVHDLVVMTRNVRHFEPTGVRILDPWDDDASHPGPPDRS